MDPNARFPKRITRIIAHQRRRDAEPAARKTRYRSM
jgi:hypothetical protein